MFVDVWCNVHPLIGLGCNAPGASQSVKSKDLGIKPARIGSNSDVGSIVGLRFQKCGDGLVGDLGINKWAIGGYAHDGVRFVELCCAIVTIEHVFLIAARDSNRQASALLNNDVIRRPVGSSDDNFVDKVGSPQAFYNTPH